MHLLSKSTTEQIKVSEICSALTGVFYIDSIHVCRSTGSVTSVALACELSTYPRQYAFLVVVVYIHQNQTIFNLT